MNYNNRTLTNNVYNLAIGLIVLYGLIINIILCAAIPDITLYIQPLLFLVLYFVCAILGVFISNMSKNSLVSFLGYNMVVVPVGLAVSMAVNYYGGLNSEIVLNSFVYTTGVTCMMVIASVVCPKLFSKLGPFLFISLIAIILVGIVEIFLGQFILVSWIAAVIFSLYIGYDIVKAQEKQNTIDNAVDAAVGIYLDIANLFLRILKILAHSKSD